MSIDLDSVWDAIDLQITNMGESRQRLVYPGLLYRTFIGVSGLPARRFLSIEIPTAEKGQFNIFNAPQGFTINIAQTEIKHEGYAACILQAAASDQNDVFTIVAKDILHELENQKESTVFVELLKKRIGKWQYFFKNQDRGLLSDNMVIGLIGELRFIHDMNKSGINYISDLWNGPIKAAQDFQCVDAAAEIKTTLANKIGTITISSEIQLDNDSCKSLFLVVYRLERNDAQGYTLPEYIMSIKKLLTASQLSKFLAKLLCLGYCEKDASLYDKRYIIKERSIYQVQDKFPRIKRQSIAPEISNVKYRLQLENCDGFKTDINTVADTFKENS